MEEIIDEPFLDASHCSFVNASSELIQYYYKLKYPDTYSLSSSTVLVCTLIGKIITQAIYTSLYFNLLIF